jgi:hypothetical protein
MLKRSPAGLLALLFAISAPIFANQAQQPATSGTFILHKFAKEIGKETYSIEQKADTCTLTSHFLFTDRGSKVPLETTFTASSANITPISYSAKGQSSREFKMDDQLIVQNNAINITLSGKSQSGTPQGQWFITDGYSPVAMQEQMMRWWLANNKPAEFTVYPATTKVHIEPSATITINGTAAHGYTVAGLIWGQESLWLDDSRNLVALVSTDAEFDHFEAVREPYESSLDQFISSAVQANLAALSKLTASARVAPTQSLAIIGATLENTNGTAPIPDSVILIEDGVTTAAGPRAKIRIPKDTTTLDATGKYAIPGLWDMHAHYEQVEWGPIYLASGVTSVRDVGNEFNFITTLHTELDRKDNPAIGPHIEFAGIIDGPGPVSIGAVIASTPAEGIALVDKYKAAGARQIKIYSSMRPNVLKAITARAHSLGLTVTGHIPDGMTAIDGVNDGMDQINHIQYEMPYFTHSQLGPDGRPDRAKPPVLDLDSPRARDLITTLKTHYTVLDPTMALFEIFLHTAPLNQLEPGIDHVAPQLREALDSPPAANPELAKARWAAMMATLRTLHQAGIPIVAGTDQAIPGYSLHRELEIYVQAGFTPLEALQSATIVAAKALGVQNESGSIEPGKRADVLLLDADPLADIHNTRKVWRTVAAGAVYSPAPLWTSVDFRP